MGKSQRDVLKEAGVAHDYLQTDPAHGRRIDRVARVAEALEWTLPDILGIEPPPARIDDNKAAIIKEAISEATNQKAAVYIDLFMALYNHFLDEQEDEDPELVRKLVRYELKRTQAAISKAA